MNPNVLPSLRAPLVGVITPQSLSAAALSTAWIDMGQIGSVLFTLAVGAIAAGGTLDAIVEEATSSGGAGAQTITSKTITQLTDTDDNKQVEINLRSDELDVADGYRYARLTITAAVAASLVAATARAFDGRYATADLSTVDEVKS